MNDGFIDPMDYQDIDDFISAIEKKYNNKKRNNYDDESQTVSPPTVATNTTTLLMTDNSTSPGAVFCIYPIFPKLKWHLTYLLYTVKS